MWLLKHEVGNGSSINIYGRFQLSLWECLTDGGMYEGLKQSTPYCDTALKEPIWAW